MSALLLTIFSRLGRLVKLPFRSAVPLLVAGELAAVVDGVAPMLNMLIPRFPLPNPCPYPCPIPILLKVYAEKRFEARRSSASLDFKALREGSEDASPMLSTLSISNGDVASIVGNRDTELRAFLCSEDCGSGVLTGTEAEGACLMEGDP